MAEQLPLDFNVSASVRLRRAQVLAAADAEQPRLFVAAPNLDVALHSPLEAVAHLGGADPDRSALWLQGLVGPLRQLKSRRVAFPTAALDRLLHVRPPAQVTLDASSLAVARAIWAARLGLKPLRVARERQRLLASSPRWPSGFGVKDAPWPAIAALIALELPLDIDARARALMATKLATTGSVVARAGLAGSAVVIETSRPELIEALKLPGLAYAADPGLGRYRMPLLGSACLLAEPSIRLSPDLEAAIRKASAPVRPLVEPEGFPWELYSFQARDAAQAVRILETTGGVLLAGDMGAGKALAAQTPVLTAGGWARIDALSPGDQVYGSDGLPHVVRGVYPQGQRPLFRLTTTDGREAVCDDEHLWTVESPVMKDRGRGTKTLTTAQLRARLRDGAGNLRWYLPMATAIQYPDRGDLLVDGYVLGALLGDGSLTNGNPVLHGVDQAVADETLAGLPEGMTLHHQIGHNSWRLSDLENRGANRLKAALVELGVWGKRSWEKSIPQRYLRAPVAVREAVLQGLLDTDGGLTNAVRSPSSIEYTSTSEQLADDVRELVESLGGTARISSRFPRYPYNGEVRTGREAWRLCISLPDGVAPFRLPRKRDAYRPRAKYGPCRGIASIEAVEPGEAVCISVDSPDQLFVLGGHILTHNTTIALALTATLDTWPALVVAPLSAFSTWARHLDQMGRRYYLATEAPARCWAAIETGEWDAVVVSYDRLHAFTEVIERFGFGSILADEVQRIRTPGSRRSRALRHLASAVPIRIGLSGTPLTNRLDDLLPLGAFLAPGEWKPRASARDLEDLYPGDPTEAIAEHLGTLMVRRRMEDTGVKLPHRADHRVLVQLTPEQRRALEDLEAEAEAAKDDPEFSHMHAFVRLQKMRQILACPSLAGVAGPNPKLIAAVELVEDFLAQGRKGVVYVADRQVWRDAGAALTAAGIGWVGIWGSTPIADRMSAEARFHADPTVKIVLCTVQAASESVTFSPTATFLVCLSYVYAPSTLSQMEARIYRLNQTNDVDICYLHATAPGGTLDDRMIEILNIKRELFARVIDRTTHSDDTKVHYSLSDLVYLLTGSRDDALVAREAAAKEMVAREQARKRHARVTAHAHKGKNKTGEDFFDDGALAELLDVEEPVAPVAVAAILAGDDDGAGDEEDFDVEDDDQD